MRAAKCNPLDVKFGLCVGLGTHQLKTNLVKTKTKQISSKVGDHGKRLNDYDLRIGLHRVGASAQLANDLIKCRTDITAIQEMRWIGQGCKRLVSCNVYYSCYLDNHKFEFVVNKRLQHLVYVGERNNFYNIRLICAQAPTEEKDDGIKDAFYAKFEDVYNKCRYMTQKQFSLHSNTTCNV